MNTITRVRRRKRSNAFHCEENETIDMGLKRCLQSFDSNFPKATGDYSQNNQH